MVKIPGTGRTILFCFFYFFSKVRNDCAFDGSASDVSFTPLGCMDGIFCRLDGYHGSKGLEQVN